MRIDKTLTMLECDVINNLCTVYISTCSGAEGHDFIILTGRGCMTLQTSFPLSYDYTDALMLLKGVLMDVESFYEYPSALDYIETNGFQSDLCRGWKQFEEIRRIHREVKKIFTRQELVELERIIENYV